MAPDLGRMTTARAQDPYQFQPSPPPLLSRTQPSPPCSSQIRRRPHPLLPTSASSLHATSTSKSRLDLGKICCLKAASSSAIDWGSRLLRRRLLYSIIITPRSKRSELTTCNKRGDRAGVKKREM